MNQNTYFYAISWSKTLMKPQNSSSTGYFFINTSYKHEYTLQPQVWFHTLMSPKVLSENKIPFIYYKLQWFFNHVLTVFKVNT